MMFVTRTTFHLSEIVLHEGIEFIELIMATAARSDARIQHLRWRQPQLRFQAPREQ